MESTKDIEAAPGSGVKPVAGSVVQINEGRRHAYLDEVMRSAVEWKLTPKGTGWSEPEVRAQGGAEGHADTTW